MRIEPVLVRRRTVGASGPGSRRSSTSISERTDPRSDCASTKKAASGVTASLMPPVRTSIEPSLGHHREWIHACKTGEPTLCNFDYSGMLIEHNLLGNVAYRVGKKLQWDPENLLAANCPEADQLIRRKYREGWTL